MIIPNVARGAEMTDEQCPVLHAARISVPKKLGAVWDLGLRWTLEPEEAPAASLPEPLKPLRAAMLAALETRTTPINLKLGLDVGGTVHLHLYELGKPAPWVMDAKCTMRSLSLRAGGKGASVTLVLRTSAKLGGEIEDALGSLVLVAFTPRQGELPLAGRAATTLPPEPEPSSEDGEVVEMRPTTRRRKAETQP